MHTLIATLYNAWLMFSLTTDQDASDFLTHGIAGSVQSTVDGIHLKCGPTSMRGDARCFATVFSAYANSAFCSIIIPTFSVLKLASNYNNSVGDFNLNTCTNALSSACRPFKSHFLFKGRTAPRDMLNRALLTLHNKAVALSSKPVCN